MHVCTYTEHTLHLSMHALHKQVGSIWVNEYLFFGNTQGCFMYTAYLRLLWFLLVRLTESQADKPCVSHIYLYPC